VAVHETAAVAVGAVLRALVADGFYAERDLAHALRLAAIAVTELPNSMVRPHTRPCLLYHTIRMPGSIVSSWANRSARPNVLFFGNFPPSLERSQLCDERTLNAPFVRNCYYRQQGGLSAPQPGPCPPAEDF